MTDLEGCSLDIVPLSKTVGTRATTLDTGSWWSLQLIAIIDSENLMPGLGGAGEKAFSRIR